MDLSSFDKYRNLDYISLEVTSKIGWGGFGQTRILRREIRRQRQFTWMEWRELEIVTNVKMLPFTIHEQINFLLEDSMMQGKKLWSWKDEFKSSLFHVLAWDLRKSLKSFALLSVNMWKVLRTLVHSKHVANVSCYFFVCNRVVTI